MSNCTEGLTEALGRLTSGLEEWPDGRAAAQYVHGRGFNVQHQKGRGAFLSDGTMAWWAKLLATNPNDLSSIPRNPD